VAASQLDIDAEDANVVAGFYLDVDDPQMTLQRSRLHSMLLLYGRSVSHRAMATTVGRVMYLLLPLQKQARQSQVAFVIEQIVDKAQELLGLSLVVGVSSPARTVGELPRARSEADQVLDVLLTSRKGDRIATYNEVASRIFLLEVGKQLAPLLPTQPSKIALLAEHDDRHGTDLLGTLRSWLDAFGDVNLVADVMHVHPNTVRHRLRRLAEIADLDLTDPIERFVVELQLRLTAQESPPENLDS
jgi:DNA-binding PucR family transcriptional regulator